VSIRIYLIFPETRVMGLHFCRCMYGSTFIQICAVGSKIRIIFLHQSAFWSFKFVQGHPRSMILVPFESVYTTSYESVIVTIWSYLPPFLRYGDILAKNCLFLLHFCCPSLIWRPRFLCSLWNFALKLTVRKLESCGYLQ